MEEERVCMDKQIDELNERVKVRIAPSKVHGVGVFSLRDIAKGQKLYTDQLPVLYTLPYSSFGKLFPEVRQILLERWPQIVNGSRFLYPDTRIQAYMNHSVQQNYDAFNDVTLRDIKEGEEILENYMLIPNWELAHPWLDKSLVKRKKKSVV